MMKKWNTILGVVLLAQLALAAALFMNRDRHAAAPSGNKLLFFEAEAVDAVRIDDGGGESLVLSKVNESWTLPAMDGFPASDDAVEALLDKLDGLEKGWPIATTSGAAARFKVAEKEFERKITLSSGGDETASLYVGTSPGLRKVHVRLPGEDPVYAVELNSYEVEADPEGWIDTSVLELDKKQIARIELPGVTLVREGEEMVPADLAESEEAVREEVDRLVSQVAGLKIRSVLAMEKPIADQGAPELRFTVGLASGEKREYQVSAPDGGKENYRVLGVSFRKELFSVDSWVVDRMMDVKRELLVRAKSRAVTEEG